MTFHPAGRLRHVTLRRGIAPVAKSGARPRLGRSEIDQNQRSSRVLVDAPDDDAVSEHIVSPSHNSPDGREADARLRISGILEKLQPS
jgi:hypothetical protein